MGRLHPEKADAADLTQRMVLFYFGDDVADERVFRSMRGISVVVGKRRHTAARYYLRSTAEVRRFLESLNQALL